MAWYNTGTIALTNGSATVTGSGTNFLVGAQIGEALYAPDGKLYEIQTINSATVITLASNYLGSTASGQGYQIIPTQSLVADLASDVTDLISDFADVRDYAGNGKFNDGAVGTPGITFTQDQDNGLYRIGSNNWALAAGGQQVVNLTTTAMNFPDNNKAVFGAGSDLQIYSDGTTGQVTGNVNVTGTVTADGLTVDGVSTLTSNSSADGILLNGRSDNIGQFTFRSNDGATNYSQLQSRSTEMFVKTLANIPMSFHTNNTERLSIENNGDISFYEDTGTTPKLFWDASAESLGIGTSSPDAKLAIEATSQGNFTEAMRITNAGGGVNEGNYIQFEISNTSGYGPRIGGRREGSGGSGLHFYTGEGNAAPIERLRIDHDGNVGIGLTTGISSKLHVNTEMSIGADADNRAIVGYTPSRFYIGTRQGGTNYFDTVNVSAGNVGIGNTGVASTRFAVTGAVVGANIETTSADAGHEGLIVNRQNSDGTAIAINKAGATVGSIGVRSGDIYLSNGTKSLMVSGSLVLPRGASGEASSGTVSLGNAGNKFSDLYLSGGMQLSRAVTSETEIESYNNTDSGGAKYKISFKQNGTQVGVIEVGTSSTAYLTSSDYRLKENVAPLTSATERLKQLNPSRFNFIADADTTVDGFLAHEVQDIVPEAISGTKDAMRDEEYEVTPAVLDDDGNVVTEAVMGTRSVPDYQGIDQSKLVPLLVATIQELEARIAALES
jgi:hypothetical protein